MPEDSSPALTYARRSLFSGVASLALPLSGIGIVAVMTFALPSRYLYNTLSSLARIYSGLALLSPVPLAAVTGVFFIQWAAARRNGGAGEGGAAALTGLALGALSVMVFVLAVAFLPDI